MRLPPVDGYCTEFGDYLHPRGRGGGLTGWYHAGVDIHPIGERNSRAWLALAPEDGVVVEVGPGTRGTGRGGYGPWVVALRGQSGFIHWLAHLDDISTYRGERLFAGDSVGRVSNKLRHPHVHWEVRTQLRPKVGRSPWTVTIDPWCWLVQGGMGCQSGPEWIESTQAGPWAERRHPMRWEQEPGTIYPSSWPSPGDSKKSKPHRARRTRHTGRSRHSGAKRRGGSSPLVWAALAMGAAWYLGRKGK